jgi:hypothetical protein
MTLLENAIEVSKVIPRFVEKLIVNSKCFSVIDIHYNCNQKTNCLEVRLWTSLVKDKDDG